MPEVAGGTQPNVNSSRHEVEVEAAQGEKDRRQSYASTLNENPSNKQNVYEPPTPSWMLEDGGDSDGDEVVAAETQAGVQAKKPGFLDRLRGRNGNTH